MSLSCFAALQEEFGGQGIFRQGWETILQKPCKDALLGDDPTELWCHLAYLTQQLVNNILYARAEKRCENSAGCKMQQDHISRAFLGQFASYI